MGSLENSAAKNRILRTLSVFGRRRSKALLLIALLVTSCSVPPGPKFKDVTFDGFGSDALKKNNIVRSLVKYHFEDNPRIDTIYYDSLGRRIYESTGFSSLRLSRDRNGLVLRKHINQRSTHPLTDSATYSFNRKGLVVDQSWLYDPHSYRYHFNKSGDVVEKVAYRKGFPTDLRMLAKFSYHEDKLTGVESFRYTSGEIQLITTSSFYYSGDKIDSLVMVSPVQKKSKTVYDPSGLAKAEYYDGVLAISYVHETEIRCFECFCH
jgi:hypothetical protein